MDWGESSSAARAELSFLRDTFAEEVLVWSTLRHPNVCEVRGREGGEGRGGEVR